MHHVKNARACMHIVFVHCFLWNSYIPKVHTLDLQLAKIVATSGELLENHASGAGAEF